MSMKMTMWSDESPEAKKLHGQLKDMGYSIEHIFTSASKPNVSSTDEFVSGYANIRAIFIAGRTRTT